MSDNRPTAAYPPGAARPAPLRDAQTDAATLFASAESQQATLMADAGASTGPESQQATMFATKDPGATQPPPGSGTGRVAPGRGTITVLPDVRSEGERLIIVPRDRVRYEADKLLGRGGMGEVKLAHDNDIGRKVAVKRLLDEGNPHAVARFIDEVRTVGSLEHPNIVPIHDVGVDEDGALFFVMKYVEGETLASVIDKLAAGDAEYHRRYSFEARLDIFAGLMRALQYAHGQGLVHRDIKPENVMLGRYGEVVVMDWGIAHTIRDDAGAGAGAELPGANASQTAERASSETIDGSVIGTPQYMSPEQARGEVAELDGRSDLYSAFVVLYELLTLHPYIPASGTAMQMVVAAQERQPPTGFEPDFNQTAHQDAVAIELRYFLYHGLQNAKDQRFASAEEVLWELDRVRSGDCEVQCMITFMKHHGHKIDRLLDRSPRKVMALTALAGLVFLGGVAGWVAWLLG